MAYSVLAIAPVVTNLPPLGTAAELARIGDLPGVTLTQLTGPVTKQRIIDRLGRGSYNAVLWAGHATPGHLYIEGDTVEPRWLAVQLKQAKIPLIVLTACQSANRPALNEFVASFADVLPSAGVSAIVMLIDVSDTAAIEYDVALFQALASGASVRSAHETGIEAIARFSDMVQAPMLIPSDRITNGDFVTLQQHVGDLGRALASNDLAAAHKLISDTTDTLARIDCRIVGIENTVAAHGLRISKIEQRIDPPGVVVFLRVMAVLTVIVGVIFGLWQDEALFTVYPIVGVTFEGVLVVLAAALLLLANAKMGERQP